MTELDFSKPLATRSGLPVRILCTDADGAYPIVGLVGARLGRWLRSGKSYSVTTLDLVNVKTKKSGWINIYKINQVGTTHRYYQECDASIGNMIFLTKEYAKHHINTKRNYLTTIQIEWEE